jgi:hypothetical protein
MVPVQQVKRTAAPLGCNLVQPLTEAADKPFIAQGEQPARLLLSEAELTCCCLQVNGRRHTRYKYAGMGTRAVLGTALQSLYDAALGCAIIDMACAMRRNSAATASIAAMLHLPLQMQTQVLVYRRYQQS